MLCAINKQIILDSKYDCLPHVLLQIGTLKGSSGQFSHLCLLQSKLSGTSIWAEFCLVDNNSVLEREHCQLYTILKLSRLHSAATAVLWQGSVSPN